MNSYEYYSTVVRVRLLSLSLYLNTPVSTVYSSQVNGATAAATSDSRTAIYEVATIQL